nr:putative Gag-pre-integrase domain, Gag-polypeptide of LTR copia-type [Tanacetum cinerariifolium]
MAVDDVNKNQTGHSGKKTQNEREMIDHNSPFYLHASDYPKQMHVNDVLTYKNYSDWEQEMMNFMFAKNKTGFIDGSIKKSETKSDKYLPWMRCDVMIKGWLTTAMEKEIRNTMKPTPDLSAAYHLVAKDEQQRTIASSKGPVHEVAAFHTSFQGRQEQTRNQQEKGWPKNKSGFQADKTKKYSKCGRERHNKSGCFKIIRYPEWWQRKGKGDKSKPKAAMVEMKLCPISGMTEEQYAMFLKLFGENREETLIANMARNMNVDHHPKWGINSRKKERRLTKDLHCAVTFFPDFFVLHDLKAGNLIGAGDCRGGLYWMGGIKEERKAMTVTIDAWHRRLRHASNIKFSRVSFLKDVSSSFNAKVCDSCNKAKLTRLPFPISSTKTSNCFDLIHYDIWGKYRRPSLTGANYFLTIVDDYSRAVWVYLLKHKYKASLINNKTKIQLDLPLITEVMSKEYLVSSHASGPRSDQVTRFKYTKEERAKIDKGLTNGKNSPWVGKTLRSDHGS